MALEYIVTLKKYENPVEFFEEMTSPAGSDTIPNRVVEVANPRKNNKRNTHFFISAEEAELLKTDERVENVELIPEAIPNAIIGHDAFQTGDFDKPTSGTFDPDKVNWGLRRCIDTTDPYTGYVVTGNYEYSLDGEGVDVVIQDSGLQVDHPEFIGEDGTSRVQLIDWYAESGVSGTQNANHYRDYSGHGTHCAGIAAGKTFGWAKKARIYSVKVSGLEGAGDSGTGIPVSDCFDVIIGWHNNKPIDPATGRKRPTIVNMSWSYSSSYATFSLIHHRGTDYTGDAGSITSWDYGLVPYTTNGGVSYRTHTRIASVDADIQQMIDAGIHVCVSAGNKYHKIDVTGGTDYDNYVITDTGTKYYHRGSSPSDDECFTVGNVYTVLQAGGKEKKSASSECGPGTNIWAPGQYIASSTSTTNEWGTADGTYAPDPNFRVVIISGTSMSTPQICGMGACILGINPHFTPAQLRSFLINNSQPVLYDTGLDNDYSNTESICGSPNRMAWFKFNSAIAGRISRS